MKTIMMAGAAMLIASPVFANPSCLELGQIYSWKTIDNKTLIVEDNWHQKFRVSLMGWCPELPYKERLGFKVFGGTQLSCITRGDEVISSEYPMGHFHCPITTIVLYTPEMENA